MRKRSRQVSYHAERNEKSAVPSKGRAQSGAPCFAAFAKRGKTKPPPKRRGELAELAFMLRCSAGVGETGAPSARDFRVMGWQAGVRSRNPKPVEGPLPKTKKFFHPPKRRGEIAELAFMRKAISLGFGVAKPWGDSDRYDFILDSGQRLWRVQVRSTEYQSHRGYAVHTYVYVKKQMVALTAREIDAIVAYIVPLDLWYVVPVEFADCKNLWFYPHGSKKGSRFERFCEAWHLLV
jgi:hypothetical protein